LAVRRADANSHARLPPPSRADTAPTAKQLHQQAMTAPTPDAELAAAAEA
jgi:hypothetical protein